MTKLPRDISGAELAKALARLEYRPTRQAGSHIRLTTTEHGEHHITVPNHSHLRVGTLSKILSLVADHHGMSRDELIRGLFS